MGYKSENRICQNCKGEFTIEPDDFGFYEKIKVPPPTFCWQCRAMRRMSFRNFRFLYKRKCDATGKTIFTLIPSEAPMPVYDHEYWISDAWDPTNYGQDYDFSRPFFEQFKDLFNKVPLTNFLNRNPINSDYGAGLDMRNCYMCFDAGFSEDSAYGVTLQKSKQCFDTINCKSCELCYYVINTTNCFKTFFSRNCTQCSDVWFNQDCVGCLNCFGCSGLRNKSYHIFNEPYTKEEYAKKLKDFNLVSWKKLQEARSLAESFWLKSPLRFRHGLKDAGCTGDYIYNSSQIRNCFFVNEARNCAHSQSIIYDPIKDSMDVTSSGIGIELEYEVSGSAGQHNTSFVIDSDYGLNSNYIINCRNVADVFGCIALHNKKYCILNKQYSKEKYDELLPKIKKHMEEMPYVDARGVVYKYGEFFPIDMSPFGFNESQGYEYFFLSKNEAEKMGYKWCVREKRNYISNKDPKDLSDSIDKVGDDIINDIIQCLHDEKNNHNGSSCNMNCVGAFNITHQELQFYRLLNLPLPRLCFNCRHVERVEWRNVPKLFKRRCMCGDAKVLNYNAQVTSKHLHGDKKCEVEFETSYASDRPEIIYCERCYQQEVY